MGPFLVVFTFILFQGSGSVLLIIKSTVELNTSTKAYCNVLCSCYLHLKEFLMF